MKFPHARDIATRNVAHTVMDDTIEKAIDLLIKNEHRDIVIVDEKDFYILRAVDVIMLHKSKINTKLSLRNIELIKIPSIDKDINVLQMLKFLEEKTEYICVVDKDKLFGLITHTDIARNIDPEILMNNFKIEDFLKLIRRAKWVGKDATTEEILADMAKGIYDSAIIVEDLKPIGILTTKDVINLIKYNSDLSKPISNYMTSPIDTVEKNISIAEALDYIKKKHYKRVVVVDENGMLAGVVTQKELISLTYSNWALMMREHEQELKEINTMLKMKNKEYELLASTDPLTGLYNRYKFEQLFDSSKQLWGQKDAVMTVILADIDHFKAVNDTYGHNVGDIVLQMVANTIKNNIRETDIACRWGGEEFAILIPAIGLEKGVKIAQKLKDKISQQKIKNIKHPITASFGVAQVNNHTLEEIINEADIALYKAKENGRNKVEVYTLS